MREKYEILKNLENANAGLAFGLRVFGDHLAEREGYKVHKELDAVHYFIVNKYNWLPSIVRAMNIDDLRFLLEEEMEGWNYPIEAQLTK